mmetsp:Transcript_759/g.1229  ORF Transcript_759/g.1229 Transcript_759/m.1229 type:complete len:212 (+) Transcript_759:303-938(+)
MMLIQRRQLVPVVSFCETSTLESADMELGTDNWTGWGNPVSVASPGYGNGGLALIATDRTSWANGVYQRLQNLDCLVKGQKWDITAKVNLYDSTGNFSSCNPKILRDCPSVRLYYEIGPEIHGFLDYHDTDMLWKTGDWNDLQVSFPVPLDGMTQLSLIICGGQAGTVLKVDDVAFFPSQPSQQIEPPCGYENTILNGSFEHGSTKMGRLW